MTITCLLSLFSLILIGASLSLVLTIIFGLIGVISFVISLVFQNENKEQNDIFREEVKKDFYRQTVEFKDIVRKLKSDALFEDWGIMDDSQKMKKVHNIFGELVATDINFYKHFNDADRFFVDTRDTHISLFKGRYLNEESIYFNKCYLLSTYISYVNDCLSQSTHLDFLDWLWDGRAEQCNEVVRRMKQPEKFFSKISRISLLILPQ